MYVLAQPRVKHYPPYVFFKDEFTKEECLKIIEYAKALPEQAAKIGSGANGEPGIQDGKIRSSKLHWIEWGQEVDWIFTRLANVVAKTKAAWYPFSLTSMPEGLQITRYLASEGGHYAMHKDMGDDEMSTRKLSIVMLLNDPSEFEGGQLELLGISGDNKAVPEVTQGSVIVFPSWELHRVMKVTKGERWSLVNWVHGPPFT